MRFYFFLRFFDAVHSLNVCGSNSWPSSHPFGIAIRCGRLSGDDRIRIETTVLHLLQGNFKNTFSFSSVSNHWSIFFESISYYRLKILYCFISSENSTSCIKVYEMIAYEL